MGRSTPIGPLSKDSLWCGLAQDLPHFSLLNSGQPGKGGVRGGPNGLPTCSKLTPSISPAMHL